MASPWWGWGVRRWWWRGRGGADVAEKSAAQPHLTPQADVTTSPREPPTPPQTRLAMGKYSPAILVLGGVALGATVVLAVQTISSGRRRRKSASKEDIRNGLEECIGNTPLIRIRSLSEATGCDILGKAEVHLPASPRSSPVWTLTDAVPRARRFSQGPGRPETDPDGEPRPRPSAILRRLLTRLRRQKRKASSRPTAATRCTRVPWALPASLLPFSVARGATSHTCTAPSRTPLRSPPPPH